MPDESPCGLHLEWRTSAATRTGFLELSVQEFISVKVQTLRELFSGDYRFRLPWFQRAYAWATEDVGLLLTHVSEAATNKPADTHYLLGTIVIANEPGDKWTDIVDGQQRIMTLTILFSVLRDLEFDPVRKAEIQSFIAGDTYRFVPQDGCADFFNRYVQAGSATTIEMEEDADDILGAQSNIMENREFLKEQFTEAKHHRRVSLATFSIFGRSLLRRRACVSAMLKSHGAGCSAARKPSTSSMPPAKPRIR